MCIPPSRGFGRLREAKYELLFSVASSSLGRWPLRSVGIRGAPACGSRLLWHSSAGSVAWAIMTGVGSPHNLIAARMLSQRMDALKAATRTPVWNRRKGRSALRVDLGRRYSSIIED